MKTLARVAEMQAAAAGLRGLGKRIGLVPTMGALHAAHLSLVRAARQQADVTVVSLFVNPKQFGPREDFSAYPRDRARDAELLAREGVEILFAPAVEEVYPDGFQTTVSVARLREPLCGRARPGHFDGVATVVLKLFNIVQPQVAFFGRKDAQQAVLIQHLVRDLNLAVEVVVCPIVREPDGLALSSRNAYLSPEDRRAALVLYRALCGARALLEKGERHAETLAREMRAVIEREPRARIDYVEVVDAATLEPLERLQGRALIALAVQVGPARLIDNMLVEETAARLAFHL
ncbi:MAG: pantoate--beta-alanine ligase [Terriglobia bacterium]